MATDLSLRKLFFMLNFIIICVGMLIGINGIINCYDGGEYQSYYYQRDVETWQNAIYSSYPFYTYEYRCGLPYYDKLYDNTFYPGPQIGSLDVGFYYRLMRAQSTWDNTQKRTYGYSEDNGFLTAANVFPFLLTYAIVMVSGWIITGVVGILAYKRNTRMLILITCLINVLFYIFHVIFFAIISYRTKLVTSNCPLYYDGMEFPYNWIPRLLISSMNFFGYAILAFVVGFLHIFIGFFHWALFHPETKDLEDMEDAIILYGPGTGFEDEVPGNEPPPPVPADGSQVQPASNPDQPMPGTVSQPNP